MSAHTSTDQPEQSTPARRAYRVDGEPMTASLPQVRCTESMLARVHLRAQADDTYPSDLIRTAVQEWLDKPMF